MDNTEEGWMRLAIEQAQIAYKKQEVPVGAIVVKDNAIIGAGFNQPISSCDPTAHAEIVALRDAAAKLKNYRLVNATLYVTIEPCTMCFGALMHARINTIVFGAAEPRAGVLESQLGLISEGFYNHKIHYKGGVLAKQCSGLIAQFFRERRS